MTSIIRRITDALEAAQQETTWHFDPPPGWFAFGTHIDTPGPLDFWGADDGGMPIWERPAQQAPAVDREALVKLLQSEGVVGGNVVASEIIASGILQDVSALEREAEASGLEKAAGLIRSNPLYEESVDGWTFDLVFERAQQVREGNA